MRGELVTRRSASALFLSASHRNRGARIGYGGVYASLRTAFTHLEVGQDGMHLGGMHTLRRSGATRFHARNRDLLTLARLLGHASLTTTQRYVRLELSALREALEAVEEGQRDESGKMITPPMNHSGSASPTTSDRFDRTIDQMVGSEQS